MRIEMSIETRQVVYVVVIAYERHHAGAALTAWNLHAIDVRVLHTGEDIDRLSHFGGRHVLAFPAECIADAIDEIEISVLVLAHEIAGAEPGVALLEHVAQNLVLILAGGGVALEAVSRLRRLVDDLADDLAGFVWRAANAESVGIAHRLLSLHVESHNSGRKPVCDEPRNAADSARLTLEIEDIHVAFGRSVEFQDMRKTETALELLPQVRPQPVPAHKPDAMARFIWVWRRLREIAA